jgi:glycosyltransferase involved in cell wall biosynthesis
VTILEACFSPSLGGLELYCLKTAHQLGLREHKVFLWLAEGSRMLRHPLADSLEVRTFSQPYRFDPLFCRQARNFVKSNSVDVIHLHRSRDLASFTLCRQPPRVLTLQIESRLPKRDLYHRFVYARLDRLLTITERMKGFANEALPVKPDRVHTLHYGIDAVGFRSAAEARHSVREAWGISGDALLIGLVGRLEESKGQDVLLRSFASLHHDFPDARLLFAGEPPPEKEGYDLKLKYYTGELGISDRVHFAGFHQNIADVYAALDICVLASREEAFGLVLLEAMASGLPLIATNAGGVPEIVQDGISGLLVPPGDVGALSNALKPLIQNVELRKKLGDNGQRIVRKKFSLEKHLSTLEEHFEAVAGAGSGKSSRGNPKA